MLFLKHLLMFGGVGMILVAAGILAYDIYSQLQYRRAREKATEPMLPMPQAHWRGALALALLAWGPILLALGIVVVPSGMAGVRVSQTNGTLPGTLYPGVHFVTPLVENVALFDTRDQLFTTGDLEEPGKPVSKKEGKVEPLEVQAKEGLTVGLAINVRYRLDAEHLDYIQNNLPQPVEKEIVPAVVASAFREVVPNYTVRDVFAAKREEIRKRTADEIDKTAGGGWHRREGSDGARHSAAAGIRQRARRPAAEGAGERPAGLRNRDPGKAGAHLPNWKPRRNQGAASTARGG